MFGNFLGMMRPGGFVNGGGMMSTGPVSDMASGGFMGNQNPPMATFPGSAEPVMSNDMGMQDFLARQAAGIPSWKQQNLAPQAPATPQDGFARGPMRGGGWRTPPMGGGFMGGGFPSFGGGMFRSPFGGGFSPFGGGFGGGFFGSPSRMSMGNYMGNLMQPFSFGFQPPQTQQAPQPQAPQMPMPNIGQPQMPDGFYNVTGGGN